MVEGQAGKRQHGADERGKNEPVGITDPWNMGGPGSHVRLLPAPGWWVVDCAEVLMGSKRRCGRVAGLLPFAIANFLPIPASRRSQDVHGHSPRYRSGRSDYRVVFVNLAGSSAALRLGQHGQLTGSPSWRGARMVMVMRETQVSSPASLCMSICHTWVVRPR